MGGGDQGDVVVPADHLRETRDHDVRPTALDVPGSYANPASVARDVEPYAAGQRALTLVDVKMMVAGEWLALPTPV